jgi:glycosyltransferase involved in cell wall biosynthesis
MPKLIRVTTVPLALKALLTGQMRYMKEHGFDVLMVSSDGPELNDVIANEKCPHYIIPMTRAITPFKDLSSLWKLYRLFKREKPNIVHSHTPKAGLLSMLAAKMAGVPLRIHTVAGLRFMTTSGTKRKLLINMERLTCKFANHVWANSFSLQNYIQQNNLCAAAKLGVIGNGSTNGINLQRFNRSVLSNELMQEIKNKIKYDPQYFYFLFVGRLVKDKGIKELVEAFSKINKDHPATRLILVGSFENELDPVDPETFQIINEHPGIIQAGWDNRTEYYFSLANMLVFPSYREGFPNVVLQAGAMLCPVLCSRIEGNVDIVDDGINGIIFQPQNASELETKMRVA